ncbi:LacI family DNA-binding transcriptional regulator [Pelagibacterium xiamenense]|uniref:LacI family DNA-binding transcriptional regulator n=1 Tax=Pelagibacterium xiamenense TaxID=2901140 RepID=UPI001E44B074|nr:LacI family DNA-binding transcriptional regulator [Pelagibacterium xiamenense]MCD7060592.1 LacI family transcriptional regulator [Pelagibacterium xiamenense]
MSKTEQGRPPGTTTERTGHKAPTIRDVAREAGVSIGTVSKALNGAGALKAETRERVIGIARKMGFRPNDLAQSLHRGQSFTVGLISNDSFGRFTMPIMEGLERELAAERIAVFMSNATDDPERERQHIDQLMGKRVDGLVFTARRADRRPSLTTNVGDLPRLYVFSQSDDPDSFCLLPDDEGGARLATEHLIGLGCRRVAHVTGPEHFEAVRLRLKGYHDALDAAGLDPDPSRIIKGVWSEQWGREAIGILFADPTTAPDGIVCGNDQIGRGVLEALRDLKIPVPGSVRVVGFDNWDVMTEAARPRLTSIDMNLYDLGREAGRRIIRMIGGETFKGVLRLPCTLVVRESCGGTPNEHKGQET